MLSHVFILFAFPLHSIGRDLFFIFKQLFIQAIVFKAIVHVDLLRG